MASLISLSQTLANSAPVGMPELLDAGIAYRAKCEWGE